MTGPIDYQAVLADLQAKRAQIDAAIAGIAAVISGALPDAGVGAQDDANASTPSPKVKANQSAPGIQADTFFGLSTASAVRRFLSIAKRPQNPRAIADALHAGGQVHAVDPKTAYTNVYTALKRGKDVEFSQTRSKEWGLTEWYASKPKGDSE